MCAIFVCLATLLAVRKDMLQLFFHVKILIALVPWTSYLENIELLQVTTALQGKKIVEVIGITGVFHEQCAWRFFIFQCTLQLSTMKNNSLIRCIKKTVKLTIVLWKCCIYVSVSYKPIFAVIYIFMTKITNLIYPQVSLSTLVRGWICVNFFLTKMT